MNYYWKFMKSIITGSLDTPCIHANDNFYEDKHGVSFSKDYTKNINSKFWEKPE